MRILKVRFFPKACNFIKFRLIFVSIPKSMPLTDRRISPFSPFFEKEHELHNLKEMVIFKDFFITNLSLALFLKIVLAKSWSMSGKVEEKKTGTFKLNCQEYY